MSDPRASWLQRPRLSLLMAAAGAVLGVGIAGSSLFASAGSQGPGVPPEDAATVNGRPILQSDFTAQTEMQLGVAFLKATPDQRRQILDDMIREELLVQRGLELNEPGTDAGTRAAIVLSVNQQIAVDATAEVPTEAKLKAFYEAHRAKYQSVGEMTLHDLVAVPGAADATADAAAALRAGTPLEAVEARYGLKESGKLDGAELYFAAQIHLGKPLFQVAEGLADGQVAGPVTVDGVRHVLAMQHNKPPVQETYAEARDEVYNDFKDALQTRLREGEYRYLRARADVRIAPRNR